MDINNRHIISPKTHMVFIVPRPMGIGSLHKSGTGNNQGRQRTTPSDNQCFNRNDFQSKSNDFLLPLISVYPPFNNLVINPSRISSVRQHSSSSSHNTPPDNRLFNSKYSKSNINEFPSPVIPVPPPLNDSVINPIQLSSVCQQSSSSSQNNPRDNLCFNSKDINSKSNVFSLPVIPVPPPLNDSVITTHQLSSVF